MKPLRRLLDQLHPLFAKGGKLEKLYPLYEAADTFLYTPGEVTSRPSHIRDSMDLKRMMSLVVVALVPAIFMAMYNTGFQANRTIENRRIADVLVEQGLIEQAEVPDLVHASVGRPLDQRIVALGRLETEDVSAALGPVDLREVPPAYGTGWQGRIYERLGFAYDPGSYLGNLLYGALYFLPVYLVTMVVGGTWEVLFAIVRRHEVNEGFLVTGMLFPLILPPTIPLWQVALGISFGVVIGKEIFGGTGKNFLNPALTARAFLYFAYPVQSTGDMIWTALDGFTGATPLGVMAAADMETVRQGGADAALHVTWAQALFGNLQGSMGETSVIACLLGAAFLIMTGIGSWRIMAACVIGALGLSSLFYWGIDSPTNPMFAMNPLWHLAVGGFAFGVVFMATDPVSAAMTDTGKWIYGILVGVMTVLIRVVNPAFPEGVMLAILFGNVFAPTIDYFVVQANIQRRLARDAA